MRTTEQQGLDHGGEKNKEKGKRKERIRGKEKLRRKYGCMDERLGGWVVGWLGGQKSGEWVGECLLFLVVPTLVGQIDGLGHFLDEW